jgi:LmbE family N-acetylglucosaminyl deacetylase
MSTLLPDNDGLSSFIRHWTRETAEHEPWCLHARSTITRGRIVQALQPHPDDVALSIGGFLARIEADISLLTIFCGGTHLDAVTQRSLEDQECANLLHAQYRCLEFAERASIDDPANIDSIGARVRSEVIVEDADKMLMAPAAVSRHPDHRVVQRLAIDLGCAVFWEDVAFWGIYGCSIDDRVLFSQRRELKLDEFTLVAVDISSQLEAKASMLSCYQSQSRDRWRPLRYGWTAARECGAPFDFCERLFVRDDRIPQFERLVGGVLVRAKSMLYGTSLLRTAWIAEI